jgi:transposase
LRVLKVDGELEALRMLTDRREALTRRRVQIVNRLQVLLAELIPGKDKRDITVLQAPRRCSPACAPATSPERPDAGSGRGTR